MSKIVRYYIFQYLNNIKECNGKENYIIFCKKYKTDFFSFKLRAEENDEHRFPLLQPQLICKYI